MRSQIPAIDHGAGEAYDMPLLIVRRPLPKASQESNFLALLSLKRTIYNHL
jgi:hypothetical protein